MGQKRHLPQIKLFEIVIGVDKIVNDYVIEIFSKTGNDPIIRHSGNFISVTCNELVETNYISKQIINRSAIEAAKPKKFW
ncbi:MAG: hypothetical protein P4L31_07415 [Candidatus Babeliales bacterium]|nr:hypothetical protein [Candidatus Babeliales bacterium]